VTEELECLDKHKGNCSGNVEYRMSLTGTGTMIPRCDYHWEKRLDFQEETTRKYGSPDSDVPPSWFKSSWGGDNEYGEHWGDDY
jgi:hypothetical protein